MTPKTLFFSWQSDLDPKSHHYLIRDALSAAIKNVNKDITFELSLDKDTQKTSGSPDVAETIFKKIRAADIFVADVTIINPDGKPRLTPNPNVLIELGYAVHALGWERIICVINTDSCKPEDLPFDIRKHRVSTYNTGKGIKDALSNLTGTMTTAIKSIYDDYEGIIERFQSDQTLLHDQVIFAKFNGLVEQGRLFESLEFVGANLRTNDVYYKLWDKVDDFNEALENHFLNVEIQSSFDKFAKLVNDYYLFVATKLFSEHTPGQKYAAEYEMQSIEITPEIQFEIDQSQRYRYPDSPSDNDWNGYHKRKYETQDEFNRRGHEIREAYKEFRLLVKKHLLI
jgi:hypothetical protein